MRSSVCSTTSAASRMGNVDSISRQRKALSLERAEVPATEGVDCGLRTRSVRTAHCFRMQKLHEILTPRRYATAR